MSLFVAIQMDPPERLDAGLDSSTALAAEAIARGHTACWYEPASLALGGGVLTASTFPFSRLGETVRPIKEDPVVRNLRDMDVVLIRQDPPFDMAYITTTYMLEHIQPDVLVLNDPAGLRNAPEKLLPLYFPDITPPTLVTSDLAAIEQFRGTHGDLVLKPLYAAGGGGVLFLSRQDPNLKALLALEAHGGAEPVIVQPYLPAILDGDKRIIVIDGEPVGAVLRRPAAGEIRANLHAGGEASASELTPRDRDICSRLSPILREMGLLLAGLDVIGGWLIEINVTSPGMITDLRALSGVDAAKPFWEAVESRITG